MTNYCTKCASFYEKPGTCNCYAPAPITLQPPTGGCPVKNGLCYCSGACKPQTAVPLGGVGTTPTLMW